MRRLSLIASTVLCFFACTPVFAQVVTDSVRQPAMVGKVENLDDQNRRDSLYRDSLYRDSIASLPLALSKEEIPAVIYYGYEWNTVNTRGTYCFDQTRTYWLPLDSAHFRFPARGGKVISPYGTRSGRMHTGVDYKQQLEDSIFAAWDGVVRMAKMGYYGYGGIVVVRHSNGLETFYAHLSKIKVRVNQRVKAGELVGLAGRTGRATTEHLHFETRFLYQSLNPALLIDFESKRMLTDTLVVSNGKFYTVDSYRKKARQPVFSIPITEDTAAFAIDSLSVAATDSLPVVDSSIAKVNVVAPVANTKPKSQSSTTKKPAYHVVKSGDTLYAIARKYHTTVAKLCELNHIKESGILSLGQKIKLP